MNRRFKIGDYHRLKADGVYPWPCKSEPSRTCELFTSDVLTLQKDGTFLKHTGLCTFGHVIPMEDVEHITDPVMLEFI